MDREGGAVHVIMMQGMHGIDVYGFTGLGQQEVEVEGLVGLEVVARKAVGTGGSRMAGM